MAKFLLIAEEGQTVRYDFAAEGEGYDPIDDLHPVAAEVQAKAEEAFGSVFCIGTMTLQGPLEVRREE